VYSVQKSSKVSLLIQRYRILSSFDYGRARSPDVISYTTPKDIETFANEGLVSKSGATVIYGPYNDIPSSALIDFIHKYQQPVTVHYHHDQPVLEVLDLKRSVEISHWGANLNTQDEIFLHNAGPL
jgi:oligosaccharyltransferase complex subunit alpha (ribophorin I)